MIILIFESIIWMLADVLIALIVIDQVDKTIAADREQHHAGGYRAAAEQRDTVGYGRWFGTGGLFPRCLSVAGLASLSGLHSGFRSHVFQSVEGAPVNKHLIEQFWTVMANYCRISVQSVDQVQRGGQEDQGRTQELEEKCRFSKFLLFRCRCRANDWPIGRFRSTGSSWPCSLWTCWCCSSGSSSIPSTADWRTSSWRVRWTPKRTSKSDPASNTATAVIKTSGWVNAFNSNRCRY